MYEICWYLQNASFLVQKDLNRIFRIAQHAEWDGGRYDIALTARPFAEVFKLEFPEVEEAVRVEPNAGGTITYENNKIRDNKIFYADSNFFNVFTHHFLYGDSSALSKPKSIVLTQSIANTLFGSAREAFGKVVSIDGGDGEEITGIIEDVPTNSHFTFDGLRSMRQARGAWGSDKLYTYILLHRNSSIAQLESKIPAFFDKYLKSVMEGAKYRIELQPLTSIHLHSNLDYEIQPNGNISFIILFLIIAALLLIIASVNYVNLTTARVSSRLKEIGIRKASGSTRIQLAWIFFSESILITFLAGLIAMVIVQFCMPWFLHIIDNNQVAWRPNIWQTLAVCSIFTVIVIVGSGIYPAIFLSGFRMIPSLKGQMGESRSSNRFREFLVGFQLFTTIAMIAASIIIFQQLNYVNKKDLGFEKTNVIVFHLDSWDARNKIEVLKRRLLGDPLIKSVCAASGYLGDNKIGELSYGVQPSNDKISVHENLANIFFVDEDFLHTLQIKLKGGGIFLKL